MTEFSDKLKQLRESKGWSKTNVAKHLGIGLSTYANTVLVNPIFKPSIKLLLYMMYLMDT